MRDLNEVMTKAAAVSILSGMYKVQDDSESKTSHEKENMALDVAIASLKELMVKEETR